MKKNGKVNKIDSLKKIKKIAKYFIIAGIVVVLLGLIHNLFSLIGFIILAISIFVLFTVDDKLKKQE